MAGRGGITVNTPTATSVNTTPPFWAHGGPGPFDTFATFAPGANTAVFTSFLVERPQSFNAVGFRVQTQSGNVDVAIYDDDGTGGSAKTRIASSGSTACPGVGLATVSFTAMTLQPGWYWAGFMADNGTAAIAYVNNTGMMGNPFRSQRCDATPGYPFAASITSTLSASAPYILMAGLI